MTDFTRIAKDEFEFLRSEYDYKLVAEEDNSNGGYVTFVNQDIGVGLKLQYEFPSAFVFVFICRLVDGEFQENRLPISEDSEINCFDFNDYLEPMQKMQPAYDYGEDSPYYDPKNGLRNFTREFADRLRSFGSGILRGDLSAMPKMENIIKRRAQDLRAGE
jgi:hypothetical protein